VQIKMFKKLKILDVHSCVFVFNQFLQIHYWRWKGFCTTNLKENCEFPVTNCNSGQPSTLTAKLNIHAKKVLMCKGKSIELICTFNKKKLFTSNQYLYYLKDIWNISVPVLLRRFDILLVLRFTPSVLIKK